MNDQNIVEKFDNRIINFLSIFNNQYILAGLILLLILYVGLIPQLSNSVIKLLDNSLFKLLILFLIIYLSRKNITFALIIAVVFIILLHSFDITKMNENMIASIKKSNNFDIEKTKYELEEIPYINQLNIPEQALSELANESNILKNEETEYTNSEKYKESEKNEPQGSESQNKFYSQYMNIKNPYEQKFNSNVLAYNPKLYTNKKS